MKHKNTFKCNRFLLLIVIFLCVFPCKESYYAQADSKKIEITKCPEIVKTGEYFTLKGTEDIPSHQYLWVQVCAKTGKNKRELFVLEQITRKPNSEYWEITFSIKDKRPKYEVIVFAVEKKSNGNLEDSRGKLDEGRNPKWPSEYSEAKHCSEPKYIRIE